MSTKLIPWLWAAGLYTACTLIFFQGTLPHFFTALIGPAEDNTILLWDLWYGRKALLDPALELMHTSFMYFPGGISLYYNDYFYYGIYLNLVLDPLLGLVGSYNFLVLSSFVFSGLAAFALCRHVTGHVPSALIGGFIFAFSPQHLERSLHHVHLANMQFIPLYVLFLIRSAHGGKKRDVFAAAAALVLAALCDWNYLVMGVLFALLGYIYLAIRHRRPILGKILWRLGVLFTVVFLALAYWIVPMIIQGLQNPDVRLEGHGNYVADAAGFLIPHLNQWLSQTGAFIDFHLRMPGNFWEGAVYLGIVNLVLIALAWRGIRAAGLKYALGLGAFLILALGSVLHVYGHRTGVPLPYALLEHVPLVSHARNPARMIVMVYVFWAILASLAVKHLFFPKKGAIRRSAFALAAGLIFFDFYAPVAETTPVTLPAAYGVIQADPDRDFGVLDIPWEYGRPLMYQTRHGRPCVQGYIGRRMEKTLLDLLPFEPPHLEAQRNLLAAHKVKYIVIHKKRLVWDPKERRNPRYSLEPKKRAYARQMTTLAALYARTYKRVYEDEEAATFRVY